MARYIRNANPQPDGVHEVHIADGSCPTPPYSWNQQDLGWHASCSDAVRHANVLYVGRSDGCKHCIPHCHTV